MLILFGFCIGMAIGLCIDTRLSNKLINSYKNETEKMLKLLENQSEVIEVYTTCYQELEKAYNNCQDGISVTIKENIDLKRRLSHE